MILLEVKKYLAEKKVCNLQEIAFHFQREPSVMRNMLAHWVRKGVISETDKPQGCQTRCVQCKPELVAVYRYQ